MHVGGSHLKWTERENSYISGYLAAYQDHNTPDGFALTWWNVSECATFTALQYKSEVVMFYLSLFFSCHFLLVFQHISEGNMELLTSLLFI